MPCDLHPFLDKGNECHIKKANCLSVRTQPGNMKQSFRGGRSTTKYYGLDEQEKQTSSQTCHMTLLRVTTINFK